MVNIVFLPASMVKIHSEIIPIRALVPLMSSTDFVTKNQPLTEICLWTCLLFSSHFGVYFKPIFKDAPEISFFFFPPCPKIFWIFVSVSWNGLVASPPSPCVRVISFLLRVHCVVKERQSCPNSSETGR